MFASMISLNSAAVTLDMYIAFILRHVEIFGFHEYNLQARLSDVISRQNSNLLYVIFPL